MIGGIDKASGFYNFINYNELKVNEGKAERLFNDSMRQGTSEMNQYFQSITKLNSRVRTEKAQHIYISLAPGEQLSNDQMVDLAHDYLSKMGYSNTPSVVYRHSDTENNHIHIVTSTVNFDGEWNNTSKDWERNQEVLRELEIKYKLQQVEKQENEHKSLAELQASKYSIQNSIKTALQDPKKHKSSIIEYTGKDVMEMINGSEPLTNNDIKNSLYSRKKSDSYINLQNYLMSQGLLTRLKKDILIDKIDYIKQSANSYNNFINLLQDNDVYVREKLTKDGKRLVYGDPDNNIYLSYKQQPHSIRYESVNQIGRKKQVSTAKQKTYLKKSIAKVIINSKSLEDLAKRLSKFHIMVEYLSNKSGVYGVKFSSTQVDNPTTFKGSQIGFSLKTINDTIAENLKTKSQPTPKANSLKGKIKSASSKLDTDADSEDQSDSVKNSKKF